MLLIQIEHNTVINADRIEVITKLGDNQVRVRIGGEFYHFRMGLDEFMGKIYPNDESISPATS